MMLYIKTVPHWAASSTVAAVGCASRRMWTIALAVAAPTDLPLDTHMQTASWTETPLRQSQPDHSSLFETCHVTLADTSSISSFFPFSVINNYDSWVSSLRFWSNLGTVTVCSLFYDIFSIFAHQICKL